MAGTDCGCAARCGGPCAGWRAAARITRTGPAGRQAVASAGDRDAPRPQPEHDVRSRPGHPRRRGSRAPACVPTARPISGSSRSAAAGSRLARGSSSSSTGGSCSTARATARRCTMPRDSSATGSSARRARPHGIQQLVHPLRARRRAGARGRKVLARRQVAVEERLVSRGSRPGRAPSTPRAAARRRARARFRACGRSSVASTRSSVDLPAPLAPKTPSVGPGRPRR